MNEYLKKYEELVYFRQHIEVLNKQQGTELHHIKPRKLFPKLVNDPNNIVRLTTLEHVLAHKYLMMWYIDYYGIESISAKSMIKAYVWMTTRNGILLSDEEAASLKKTYHDILSDNMKKQWKNIEYLKFMSDISHSLWNDPNYREHQIARKFAIWKDLKYRDQQIKSHKTAWKNKLLRISAADNLKNRIKIYNIETKLIKYEKGILLELCLASNWTKGIPLYNIPRSGKNKGKLLTIYVCPWKLDKYSYLKPKRPGESPVWSLNKPDNFS